MRLWIAKDVPDSRAGGNAVSAEDSFPRNSVSTRLSSLKNACASGKRSSGFLDRSVRTSASTLSIFASVELNQLGSVGSELRLAYIHCSALPALNGKRAVTI